MPGENLDPESITRCVLLIEDTNGNQRAWQIDRVTAIGWSGLAEDATVRVRGRFQRIRKNPEARRLERALRAALAGPNRPKSIGIEGDRT